MIQCTSSTKRCSERASGFTRMRRRSWQPLTELPKTRRRPHSAMPANRRSDSSCAAFSVVPGYARAFGAAYPDVVLNLREDFSNYLAAQVLAGQIDAAIMFPGLANKNLAIRTIVSPSFSTRGCGDPGSRSRWASWLKRSLPQEPCCFSSDSKAFRES